MKFWKKISVLFTVLCVSLSMTLSMPKQVGAENMMDITLDISNVDPTADQLKVYYDTQATPPLNGNGATAGSSPIILSDPNITEYTITVPQGIYYVAVSAVDDGDEGPLSSIKRYETIEGFQPQVLGVNGYGEGETVNVLLDFEGTAYLNNGKLIVTLNSGGYIEVDTINWASQLTIPYTVGAGENADPLQVADIYLDPNDPGGDVELYNSAMKNICTDIVIGSNLGDDPNNYIIIDTVEPTAPSLSVGCCTN